MTIFFAGAISIITPLIAMFMFFSWVATDKKKPIKQRAKEVLVESIKLAFMVIAGVAVSSATFEVAMHFIN
ncbi:hypothetical protein [Serratia marcescens]|uniref:hypothetical protein n=1 Tax=Serratia marcescens TaxID=615 RepID=UPI0021BDB48E|nr:hypothetical protein [Serratia marcescens]